MYQMKSSTRKHSNKTGNSQMFSALPISHYTVLYARTKVYNKDSSTAVGTTECTIRIFRMFGVLTWPFWLQSPNSLHVNNYGHMYYEYWSINAHSILTHLPN